MRTCSKPQKNISPGGFAHVTNSGMNRMPEENNYGSASRIYAGPPESMEPGPLPYQEFQIKFVSAKTYLPVIPITPSLYNNF
jgi:hypothetical protein